VSPNGRRFGRLLFTMGRENCIEPGCIAVTRKLAPVSLLPLEVRTCRFKLTHPPLVAANFCLLDIVCSLAMPDDEEYLVLFILWVLRIQMFDIVLEARPSSFTKLTGCDALSGPEIVVSWV
jgi:hypothetical protein